MVKHIILWRLKEEYSGEEIKKIKAEIKQGLEGLVGKVPGLKEVTVYTEGMSSSNMDLMLDTTLESPEALKCYASHPAHVEVADSKVRPYTQVRSCFDFEI